jgi:N-acetylneuraminate synthase/sialic acid synthase
MEVVVNRILVIDGQTISDDSDGYIVAEIGHNHQGSVDKAKEMFRVAKECGVDAVKLQKRDNRTLFTKALYDMPYQHENSFGATYGEHREALEFGREAYVELKRYAEELGLTFFATAFDFKSVDFLADLGVRVYKTASGDLKNTPLIGYIAKIGRPMLVSTGGGTIEDVQRAYDTIMPINPQLCLLQCTAAYPAEAADMNLKVIATYRERFPDIVVGLSDHQDGISMALASYVLGARVFEKHITMHHTWKGTDHAFSLEPIGLRKYTRDLRRVRSALGDGIKKVLPCEEKPLQKMGKKLVAARDLPAGHVLTRDDIAIKSPNDGLPPYELDGLIGKVTVCRLREDDNFTPENVKGA